MALYAIGDLHLSEAADKPMDIFGAGWQNYTQRLKEGFGALGGEDICVICGDISWGMNLEESSEDFKFIGSLPGQKIILKGNHDYWWSTSTKALWHVEALGIANIQFLHNNCFFYGDAAICGTRGWFYEEERSAAHDKKIMLREVGRLETSLKAAGDKTKYVFLHYPPIFGNYLCVEILTLFRQYEVAHCCYGHIHGSQAQGMAFQGDLDGVIYEMVSADYLGFVPKMILD